MQLRGYTPEDMTSVFNTLSKEEIMKVLGHRTEAEYLSEAQKQKAGYASYNRRFVLFLLIERDAGKIIGRCGLHNWNEQHKRAEIGYVMHEEAYKRKGLMTEAVEAIIAFGFSQLGLNRIEAIVGEQNTASLAIINRFGFTKEGLLQQHVITEGGFENSLMFALLRD